MTPLQQSAETDPRQAIQAANRALTEAFERGDAAAIAALYTEDAVLLPAGLPMVRGPAAIGAVFMGLRAFGAERLDLRTVDLTVAGDTAYEVGAATVTIRLPGGEAVEDPGKYVVVWQRRGAGWKLHIDIFNSDTPPPQA
jgi:uncharacterized protein (TIGR02246 family)